MANTTYDYHLPPALAVSVPERSGRQERQHQECAQTHDFLLLLADSRDLSFELHGRASARGWELWTNGNCAVRYTSADPILNSTRRDLVLCGRLH
jgi:hypothetical protein